MIVSREDTNRLKKIDNYQRNVAMNYVVKVLGIVFSLLSTRITINYLGNNLYGLWVTIASVVSWMSSGDFGVGNGLRNRYAEAYAKGDEERQKVLLATGVSTLTKISGLLLVAGLFLCEILLWFGVLQPELRAPMDITVVFFCFNLILSVSQSVAYGQQKSWYVSLAGTGMTIASLLAILLLKMMGVSANLVLFSVVHGLCSIIPNIALIGLLKKQGTNLIHLGMLQDARKDIQKDIMGVGMNFFGIQICSIILYSTDNLIINYLIGGEAVTKYSVITKIYDTGQNLFSIMLIALWSAVTYQVAQNNISWVKKKIRQLLGIWLLYVMGVIGVSLMLNPIVKIWIGAEAQYYEPAIIILFAVYGITISFSAIFVSVTNGMNQIKAQLIVAAIGAAANIPLSIYFANNLGMGLFGIKLATLIAAILTAIVIPVQVWWILYKKEG